ncbi:MAG: hypothetical protein WCO35_02870 [Candidatus Nomurabacteria bacterium]
MDNTRKISTSNLTLPILIIAILIVVYFVYVGFFSNSGNDLNGLSNQYIKTTKIGKDVDIVNKESISFDTNMNSDILSKGTDFSKIISPSQKIGRSNPFLP